MFLVSIDRSLIAHVTCHGQDLDQSEPTDFWAHLSTLHHLRRTVYRSGGTHDVSGSHQTKGCLWLERHLREFGCLKNIEICEPKRGDRSETTMT